MKKRNLEVWRSGEKDEVGQELNGAGEFLRRQTGQAKWRIHISIKEI